ncbi:MAG: oligosaccharide flippase family protein [Planctomycetes bacterium]|nr:oligosaccharide flippase family protein [Planctomycetota bacterium]
MASLRVRTVVLALGQFVHTGMNMIMAMVLVRIRAKESYGTFRQVLDIHALIVGILGANISESLLYFLPRTGAADKPRWLSQTGQLSFMVGMAVGAVLFLTADFWAAQYNNPDLALLLRVFAFFPLADHILRMVPPAMIAEDHAASAAGFTIAVGVTKLASAIIPCALGMPLVSVFWSMNLCWMAMAVVGLIVLATRIGFAMRLPRMADLREQIGYVLPLLAGSIVWILGIQLGRFVAGTYLSEARYAEFVNGAIQLPLIGIWTASIASAIMPDLVRLGQEDKHDVILDLWHRAFRKGAILMFPVAALMLVVPDYVIRTLYGPAYAASTIIFVIYLLSIPIRAVHHGIIFRAIGHNRAIFIGALVGLGVNAAVTFPMAIVGKGTQLVFVGPALGFLAGTLAQVVTLQIMLRRLLEVSWGRLIPMGDLVPLALLSIVAAGAAACSRWAPAAEWVAAMGNGESDPSAAMASLGSAAQCALAGVVFMAVYLGAGLATNTFDKGERDILRRMLLLRRR